MVGIFCESETMAGSVNKVILVGTLGRDPEVRTFSNGNSVCNLSVATSEKWTDKSTGEKKERTEWHRVAIFNDRLVAVAERSLAKGAMVYIEGQLETRKWTDNAGVEKYTTEIVLRQFRGELTILKFAESGESSRPAARATGGGRGTAAPSRDRDLDDEIPF